MIIELTDSDAQRFIEFQKNYDTFSTLQEAGVFNVRNGKATLNFDPKGTLTDVECSVKLYKRGIEVTPILITLHT